MAPSCELYKVVKRVEEPQGWAGSSVRLNMCIMGNQLYYRQATVMCYCVSFQILSDLTVFPLCRWPPCFCLRIWRPLFLSANSPGSTFYQGKWWPHLNQYGPSHTEPDWQTVATTAYPQTKPLQRGWERAQPTLCSKNVDPGRTLSVYKQSLPWTAPSLINLQNRDIYILVHAVFSNDLLYICLFCIDCCDVSGL